MNATDASSESLDYRCPGQRHPISRAVHLGRLAALLSGLPTMPAPRRHRHALAATSRAIGRNQSARPAAIAVPRRRRRRRLSERSHARRRPRHGRRLRNDAKRRGSRGEGQGIAGPNQCHRSLRHSSFILHPSSHSQSQSLRSSRRRRPGDHRGTDRRRGRRTSLERLRRGRHRPRHRRLSGLRRPPSPSGRRHPGGQSGPRSRTWSDCNSGPPDRAALGRRIARTDRRNSIRPASAAPREASAPCDRFQADEPYLATFAEHYHALRPLRVVVDSASNPLVEYLQRTGRHGGVPNHPMPGHAARLARTGPRRCGPFRRVRRRRRRDVPRARRAAAERVPPSDCCCCWPPTRASSSWKTRLHRR